MSKVKARELLESINNLRDQVAELTNSECSDNSVVITRGDDLVFIETGHLSMYMPIDVYDTLINHPKLTDYIKFR